MQPDARRPASAPHAHTHPDADAEAHSGGRVTKLCEYSRASLASLSSKINPPID